MKAIQIRRYGGAEVLEPAEVPEPGEPEVGQAIVRIHTCGVNFIDTYQRSGLYKIPLPAILGLEGAGTIVAVGPGVTEIAPGDNVAFCDVQGTYAELIKAPAERLVKIPQGLDLTQAAALMLQGLTAHYLATSTFPLEKGHRCLIHAGAGGVGLLLIQIAKLRGAQVFTTVSTEEKAELARDAGADTVILYSRVDFQAEVQRITEGKLLNVVYDSVGQSTFERSLACLRRRGVLVSFGQSSGPVPAIEPLVLGKGSLYLTRPRLGDYVPDRESLSARTQELFSWVASGALKLRIGHTYPLSEAAAAHTSLEGRKTSGKVLLEVGPSY